MRTRLMVDACAVTHVANEVGDMLRARCLSKFWSVAFTGVALKQWPTCLWCASGEGKWR